MSDEVGAGVLGAVTCAPSPVTHAIRDPCAGVSPSAAHEPVCATAIALEIVRQANHASDLGPKFINCLSGRVGQFTATVGGGNHDPRRVGRKRWYYDLRNRARPKEPLVAA